MLISKILYLAGSYLGDKEIVETVSDNNASNEEYDLILPYLKLLNVVQDRIATEYFPITTSEVIDTTSQVFKFANLSKRLYKLIKVLKDGKVVRFSLKDGGILLPEGKYEIWYQYLPTPLVYSDHEIDDFDGKISDRIFALGVASEYCLLNGMYETSNYFEEKFVNALNCLRLSANHKTLPKRRWL